MPVIIVGMHRSGTSLLAGLLKIAGWGFGADSALLPPAADNPKGFFENAGFLDFNERIIRHFGGTWYNPPSLPAGWLQDEQVETWRLEAKAAIAKEFGDNRRWAWKEPRTSLLLPFWRSVVSDARIVLCLRNPLDVAGSLARRDSLFLEHSVALWHIYTLQSLIDSAPSERLVVSYDRLLQDHRSVLEETLGFLGGDVSLTEQAWREIDDFISNDLKHHDHSAENLYGSSRVMRATKELYRSLCDGDQSALRRYVEEASGVLPACHQATRELTVYFEAFIKCGGLETMLNTRPHRLASQLSRMANRTPALAEMVRKFWR